MLRLYWRFGGSKGPAGHVYLCLLRSASVSHVVLVVFGRQTGEEVQTMHDSGAAEASEKAVRLSVLFARLASDCVSVV